MPNVKATIGKQFTPNAVAINKKQKMVSADKDWKPMSPVHYCVMAWCCGKQASIHKQLKVKLSRDPTSPLLSRHPEELKVSKRYLSACAHSSIITIAKRCEHPTC